MAMNTEALMDKLFRWKTTVDVNGTKFYVRVVSDQTIDDARRLALLESRKLRRSMRNTDSDDFLIYLDPLEDFSDEELQNLIIGVSMREVMREYISNNPKPVMPALSDSATQEQQEEYEAELELRDVDYINNMELHVKQWQETFVENLQKRDRKYWMHVAKSNRVDAVCEERFTQVFEEYVVAASVYNDEKYRTRSFTLEQFRDLPTDVKASLRDAYDRMSISSDDIKN